MMFSIKRPGSNRRSSSLRKRRTLLNLETLDDRVTPATFTVLNTLDDFTPGSLRWAVNQANLNPGADHIQFDQNLGGTNVVIINGFTLFTNAPPATIRLINGLSITGELSITGNQNLTITGGDTSLIFNVPAGSSLSLERMQLRDGAPAGFDLLGGAIRNAGTLSMNDSTISSSVGLFGGGAITNTGTATITNSQFSGNVSLSAAAIFNGAGATLTIQSSSFSTNTATQIAGAIYNAGTANITSASFTGNTALTAGAIYNDANAALTITGSILSANAAVQSGGALVVGGGTVTIVRSQILSNTVKGTAGAAGQNGASVAGGGIVVSAAPCGWSKRQSRATSPREAAAATVATAQTAPSAAPAPASQGYLPQRPEPAETAALGSPASMAGWAVMPRAAACSFRGAQ